MENTNISVCDFVVYYYKCTRCNKTKKEVI